MKAKPTLVAVADAAKARFFLIEKIGAPLEEGALPPMAHKAPFSRDLVSDKPGRGHVGKTGRRHSEEPTSDPHDEAEKAFVRDLAGTLDKAIGEKGWRLFLVADPRSLGQLRQCLSPKTQKQIVGELAKDHVKSTVKAIGKAVHDALALQ